MRGRVSAPRFVRIVWAFVYMIFAGWLKSAVVVHRPTERIEAFAFWRTVNLPIDVNDDGVADFRFYSVSGQLGFESFDGGRTVVSNVNGGGFVLPLEPQTVIGPELEAEGAFWKQGRSGVSAVASFPHGVVNLGTFYGKDAYIGIEFQIGGKTHYGWVRIDHLQAVSAAWIIEWAYETRPGVRVYAGFKPVSVEVSEVVRPGYLRLQWPSHIGRDYQIQSRSNLDTTPWADLPFTLPGHDGPLQIDLPIDDTAHFFRVIEVD